MHHEVTRNRDLAALAAALVSAAVPMRAAVAADGAVLEEVVVTASKRNEALEDVAMSITVVGAEALEERRLADLNDVLPGIPSVSFIDFGGGRNTIVMRGLAAQPQLEDKVVGTYFGEANISQLGNVSGGGSGSANLKMVDVSRIELLRGPQGTLYGAGSMGGTLRILPTPPNLNEFEGNIEAGFSNTSGEGGSNTDQEIVLNLPMASDVFAVRLVGYNYQDSGYVHNIAANDPPKVAAAEATGAIVIDEGDIGATDTRGGRITALWRPSDAIDVSVMYAYQNTFMDGRPEVNLNLGNYQQSRWEATGKGSEYLEDTFNLGNLTVNGNLGWGQLVSSTSYIEQKSHTDRNFLGEFWEYNPSIVYNDTDNTVLSEELRLVSQLEGRLQYVVGYYYEEFKQHRVDVTEWLGTVESNIFDPGGSNELGSFNDHEEITQNALFGEISYDIIEDLTLTVGGRYFDYDRHFKETFPVKGVFNEGLPEPDLRDASETGQTFKAGLKWHVNDQMMLFAQWAEGFRLGDTIEPWPSSCDQDGDGLHDELGLPRTTQIDSDTTSNYEFGVKWTASDRLFLNGTVFYTNWTGIPVAIGRDSACGFGVVINGGEATTQGLEVEGSYYATDSLRIDMGASVVDAELASDVENVGVEGDRLPGSPEFTASLGMEYQFELLSRPSSVRLDYAYVGGFYGQVGELGEEAGDYHMVNLVSSMELKAGLTARVYVKNLTNTDVLTWVDSFPPNAVQMRPRVIGLDLKYAF